MEVWQRNLKKLKQFKKLYKHTNVPRKWNEDPVLAQWVENIRTTRKRLPSELLAALNKLKFDFEEKPDKSWQSMYAALTSFWKKHGHTYVPDRDPYKELSIWVKNQKQVRNQLPIKQIKLLKELDFDWTLISKTKSHWEFMYGELKKFKEKYGHTKLVVTDKAHYQLALWVHNIRARPHQLGDARKKRLDALGFLWQADIKKLIEQQWLTYYKQLKEFKKQHGHCNVPIKWKPNKKLSTWVSEQRLRRKNKGLIPEREALLNKINFSWSEDLVRQNNNYWNDMFLRLKNYKVRYGNTIIKEKRDKELKAWASSQRIMAREGMLSEEKKKKLESIEFTLVNVRKNSWEKMYIEFEQYVKKYGNEKPVPRSKYPTLWQWVSTQKHMYGSGTLSKEKIKRLNKIGFMWPFDLLKNTWTKRYNELVDFKKKFKHTRVPSHILQYKKLNVWAVNQRDRWRTGIMPESEYQLLDKLGFKWNVSAASKWENMFEKLSLFKERFNHFKVPEKTNSSLAHWIARQRQNYRMKKLSKDKIKKLKQLGFDLNVRWRWEK